MASALQPKMLSFPLYGDAPSSALSAVGAHDAQLKASGYLVTEEALTLPNEAVTVRVCDGKMSTTDGPRSCPTCPYVLVRSPLAV